MSVQWYIRSKDNADHLHEFLLRSLSEGRETLLEERDGSRSTRQNSALHALLRRLAGGLNDGGHTVQHPFNPEFELPWTEVLCKEVIFKPIIEAMYDKSSSTKLTKEELSEAVDVMLSRIADLTGVYVDGLEGEL